LRFCFSTVAVLLVACSAAPALAATCGPDALGVSRVATVGTEGGLEVGLKSYPHAIPLADHEVILTFDDGPNATYTPMVLKALADQCVKATFFLIGRNVAALPDLARQELAEGHTLAHHTFTHPQPTLRYMPPEVARADILKGMATVEHVVYGVDFPPGQPTDLSQIHLHTPWFRFPGFADTKDIREWFKANNVGTFGVDEWASDWLTMTPDQELKLIMGRLEKEGRGMLLFHDIHPWTAAMLPAFLKELKARGYKVVQMVPGPGQGPTVDAPGGWSSATEKILDRLHPRLLGDTTVPAARAAAPEPAETPAPAATPAP
jgi:peptidoglycan/xylan/chitin deacetylase (PgdA/CDA1 family)